MSPEYKWLKQLAIQIASKYSTMPGITPEADYSYQQYCKALYFYNTMFEEVEKLAKLQVRRESNNATNDW